MEGLLQTIPLFSALSDKDRQDLLTRAQIQEYLPDLLLFREGDPSNCFSVILEGEVDILQSVGTDAERLLTVLGPGQFFGELSLLFPERRRSASARTRTSVRMLDIGVTDFQAMIQQSPALALSLMQVMAARQLNTESATIKVLRDKNKQLAQSLKELKQAQAQLIEKEKMEHELSMARRIQESMLPKTLPEIEDWNLAAYWKPARAVSGDFYDFISYPDGRIGLVIGDVTDKGVPASLVMAITRSVLRTAAQRVSKPGELLAQVNDLLVPEMPPNMFVTCMVAVFDPRTGDLQLANAGHCLPFWGRSGGVSQIRAAGMPLGLMPGMDYQDVIIQLVPGDWLLFYSDGLLEAHNPQREMLGTARIQACLSDIHSGSLDSAGLIQQMVSLWSTFTGPGWEQEDDTTLVALRRISNI